MEFAALRRRAMEIRQQYAALEQQRYGRSWSREEVALGFVGDMGDLVKLVMAQEGVRAIDDSAAKLAHELADCLWSVDVARRAYRSHTHLLPYTVYQARKNAWSCGLCGRWRDSDTIHMVCSTATPDLPNLGSWAYDAAPTTGTRSFRDAAQSRYVAGAQAALHAHCLHSG